MSSFIHALLATGCIALAFYIGRFMSTADAIEKIFGQMTNELIRHLEKDGFVKIEIDKDGDPTLIPISEVEETARRDAFQEEIRTIEKHLEEVKENG